MLTKGQIIKASAANISLQKKMLEKLWPSSHLTNDTIYLYEVLVSALVYQVIE